MLSVWLCGVCAGLRAGVGIYDITGPPQDVIFMGMANHAQDGAGVHFRLRARAFAFESEGTHAAFVSIDAGMVGFVLKSRVIARVNAALGAPTYSDVNLCVTATHTHSGPSGFLQYTIFRFAGSGWVPSTVDAMVNGTAEAVLRAHASLADATLTLSAATVANASINRSPTAYLRNPHAERAKYGSGDVEESMVQLAVLGATPAGLAARGVINWHAVHPTSMNNTNHLISGDNKGHASYLLERARNGGPAEGARAGHGPFVGAFASSALGDVSPNLGGAVCRGGPRRGQPCEPFHSTCPDDRGRPRNELCTAGGPGSDMFDSTRIIAQRQADVAGALLARALRDAHAPRQGGGAGRAGGGGTDGRMAIVNGAIGAVHAWVRMPGLHVAETTPGGPSALCSPAFGEAFAAGTTDGPGMFDFEQGSNSTPPFWNFIVDLIHKPSKAEVACHAPKPILLPTGDVHFPHAWSPSTVPIQLLRLGSSLVIAALPTELSTMAGRRLRAALASRLRELGVLDADGAVVIAGLSNSYADYTVTYEEYQAQRYEGASTIYGPHQLAAYTQELLKLALDLADGGPGGHGTAPEDFTAGMISGEPRLRAETPPAGRAFGDVLADAPAIVVAGTSVSVEFVGGNLRNELRTHDSYLRVERLVGARGGALAEARAGGDTWQLVAEDGDVETRLHATRSDGYVRVGVRWDVPPTTPPGEYRVTHAGAWRARGLLKTSVRPYSGTSRVFSVRAPPRGGPPRPAR